MIIEEDRYKLLVVDIIKIPNDNIHLAHQPHKRYAIWDKLKQCYLSEPYVSGSEGHSKILRELRWLNSMANKDFELYNKEIYSYCFQSED